MRVVQPRKGANSTGARSLSSSASEYAQAKSFSSVPGESMGGLE